MAKKQLGAAPSDPTDAATKAYVDSALGGVSSDLVDDTSPQLGGNLDLNGNTVGDATAADLTKLHAVTADATELNYVDGVTSAIQTQLNARITTTSVDTLSNKTLTSPTIAKIGNLTTNGFVKTSAGDGTLSVDTGSYQPLDSDLTTIAGLTPTSNNIIQSVSSAWASRTPAQLKATMSFTSSDVGLGNVTNNAQYYPGGTDVAVADGGTGASNTTSARANLYAVGGSVNGTDTALTLWTGTAAQYAAIGSKDSNTVYIVT